MTEVQPKLQALQKQYGKDREKLMQEQMKLYKEHNVNPAAGCLPMIMQMPVWIGLYSALFNLATRTRQWIAEGRSRLFAENSGIAITPARQRSRAVGSSGSTTWACQNRTTSAGRRSFLYCRSWSALLSGSSRR